VAFDIETTALNPKDGHIRTVQVAYDDFVGIVDCFRTDPMPLIKYVKGVLGEIEVVKPPAEEGR
jgi:hypothetical protein